MKKVLQLYNIFGALSERVWLEYPRALSGRYAMSVAYESRAAEALEVDWPAYVLPRVAVETTVDPAGKMETLAADPRHPARELFENGGFSVVHGHTGTRVLHAAPFIAAGVGVVLSLYGFDASRLLLDAAWGGRYRWAGERGAVFVVLCESMRRTLLGVGVLERAIRTIHLGLELERWPFAPQAAPAEVRFVFVGRLVEKKGVGVLLEAMAVLARGGGRWRLDVVGYGPLLGALREAVVRLGLGEVVRFLGTLPREEVGQLMKGATAFVLPSVTASDGDTEGTPIVLMEAAALGIPCVTTRHAGNPDVLPEGWPLLADEGDVEGLARALEAAAGLSAVERIDLQQRARQHVEREFDLRQTVAAYDALYASLANP